MVIGRLEFIRKTYAILTVQLAVTTAIIVAFVMVDSIRNYVQHNPGLLYSAIIISLILVCALSCFRSLAESFPINIVLLGFFTLCQAYLLGTISSFFNTTIVLQALAMTCAITGILTVYAWTVYHHYSYCVTIID
jgi:FtsH-binding integral membrane protein